MNSRQRLLAALHHQPVDRTPVFEYVLLSPLADRLLGRVYAADEANWVPFVDALGWESAVRQNARDRVELAALLGHDMLYVYPPPADSSAKPGAPGELLLESDDPVERMRWRNERAAHARPLQERDLLIYRYVQEELRRRELDLPLLAPAYVHGVWTDVELMQTMLLAPDVAHEHFALATERALQLTEGYIALGIEQIGVGGDFAGNRPIISPAAYRAFIVPEVRRMTERIHAAGRYAINASDGNLWSVMDDFVFGCGVDGYLEIDMHAGMDLRRLKASYGERVTFYGNLDCGNTLSFGSPEQVRQHTLDCLEAGWGNGGHVLCASNAIAASVSLTNYLAVVNAYRDHFSLPRLEAGLA
jgi:uroporphyrinogen decarboxylase